MVKAIDYWCNPFSDETMQQYLDSWDIGHPIKWWHMEDRWKGHETDDFARILDEAGVEKVFIPSAKMYSFQLKTLAIDVSTEQVAAMVQKRPDKFGGLCGINPYDKMNGVRELEKSVKEYGFQGAWLHTYGFDRSINHRDYWPFYAKCVELDVPVIMQVGHSAEFMPSEFARPMLIDDIAIYFPDLRIVGAHTGWPWLEEMIAMAWKHPNVYLGTSAHAPKYWDPSMIAFLNSRGKGKVLWGTDWPVLLHKESLEQVEGLTIKEDAKIQLIREAAVKVFKL